MNSNADAKKLAEMLDKLCKSGSEHINVKTDCNSEKLSQTTYNSADCGEGNMACRIPTLHKGIDERED